MATKEAVVPKGVALKANAIPHEVVDLEMYKRLAAKVGYAPDGAMQQHESTQANEKLQGLIASMGLLVYDDKTVRAYMNKMYKKRVRNAWTGGTTETFWSWVELRSYKSLIPYPVLLTIEAIQKEFKPGKDVGNSLFEATYVDVRKVVKPDPFLRVSVDRGVTWFIIERWDEPAFRMEDYVKQPVKKGRK